MKSERDANKEEKDMQRRGGKFFEVAGQIIEWWPFWNLVHHFAQQRIILNTSQDYYYIYILSLLQRSILNFAPARCGLSALFAGVPTSSNGYYAPWPTNLPTMAAVEEDGLDLDKVAILCVCVFLK